MLVTMSINSTAGCCISCSAMAKHNTVVDLLVQVENAESKKARAKAQAEAGKAQERLAKYSARLEEVRNEGGPKIEVGSLEEVLTKMEKDTDGTWDEVMFIPPGGATKKL